MGARSPAGRARLAGAGTVASRAVMAWAAVALAAAQRQLPSALDVRTFSSVIKGGLVEGSASNVPLFDINATGAVQHVWFTMGGGMARHVTIAFFVDNETSPSIAFTPTIGLALDAPEDAATPWGTEFQGRTGGSPGEGVYSTRRVPFGSRLRVVATFDLPPTKEPQSFFFIIRGLEALRPASWPGIVVGGLLLPPSARLKLYTTTAATVRALDYVTAANVSAGTGGMLHEVYMHGNSSLFLFMEGCFRAFMDGSDDPTFLSSGTEDYFNSANYFNAGTFRHPNSGLTYKNETSFTIAAYRVHERDPIVFQNGLRFVWRNSDEVPGGVGSQGETGTPPRWLCPLKFPWNAETAAREHRDSPHRSTQSRSAFELLPVQVTFLVWVYEWPAAAA